MKNDNELLLDDQFADINQTQRRRNLLPTWIKVFIWIFLIFGGFGPLALLLNLFSYNLNLSLYGMETNTTFSLTGTVLVLLFTIKGVVAYGLWIEKKWAVNSAIYDAILGIIVCCLVMFFDLLFALSSNLTFMFNIRLELFLLIPYLFKMRNIKTEWETGDI